MSLTVVHADVKDRQATITIQADTMEEVMSPAARQLAIQEATSRGLSRCGTSGGESAYPVDARGKSSDDMLLGRGTPVAAYRCDFKVSAGL